MTEVFLDTSFAIALSSVTDRHHFQAMAIAAELTRQKTKLVTTQAILLELGNALSKARYRKAAVQLLTSLETDPNVTIIPLSTQLYSRALELFKTRLDKEWGLVDCISFTVMRDRNISDALTADEHFLQAGFCRLLL